MENTEYIGFNLNDKILVQLNDDGYKHWQTEWNKSLPQNMQEPIEYFINRKDKDGFVSFQCWEFMQMFGGTIRFGYQPMFNTNVRFIKNTLK